jgi:Ni,Fe-hydrogenase I large subunit
VNLEGELVVRVGWSGGHVTAVDVMSSRPHLAGRVLAGRTVTEAIDLVPRLFSICGRSQGVAAALAFEAAAGRVPEETMVRSREAIVRVEAAQEVLRRVLLDWPRLAGDAPDASALADARRAVASGAAEDLRAIVQARILGAGAPWTALDDADGGERWIASGATQAAALVARLAGERSGFVASEIALLPADGGAVARAVGASLALDDGFERAPVWQGAPAETGALARMRTHPWVEAIVARTGCSALARIVARLVELVALVRPEAPPRPAMAGTVAVAPGAGLGWVETARGLLVHAAETAAGAVRRYRIVAPTEWNFHPRGALARGLEGRAAASEAELERLVHIAIESLDPCVAHRVEVSRA